MPKLLRSRRQGESKSSERLSARELPRHSVLCGKVKVVKNFRFPCSLSVPSTEPSSAEEELQFLHQEFVLFETCQVKEHQETFTKLSRKHQPRSTTFGVQRQSRWRCLRCICWKCTPPPLFAKTSHYMPKATVGPASL